MTECPFCPLEEKTPWYLWAKDGMVVCRDLHNRGYKYRLLVVGPGKKWHRPIEQYSSKERARFLDLGRRVAKDHIKQGKASQIADIDMKHWKYPQHFHIQFCMT